MAAGIARVVCAIGDPNPEVDGRGLDRLRAANVEVELAGGRHETRARRQNAGFRTAAVARRPFVLLKLAATLDGRIATSTGESRWISSPESRRLVHDWRAEMDAVAVGSGTALADDPELLPRDAEPPAERLPLRVVFDRRGRLGAESRLVRSSAQAPVLRIAPPGAPPPPAGVDALEAASLEQALRLLGEREVTSLLVEGGAELAGALLRAGPAADRRRRPPAARPARRERARRRTAADRDERARSRPGHARRGAAAPTALSLANTVPVCSPASSRSSAPSPPSRATTPGCRSRSMRPRLRP
jgi:diaminohydroxyphosphoribosylaminopyrimidine deaminase/5-amino-6-(5-phosphoribosylamino)uracil reductase